MDLELLAAIVGAVAYWRATLGLILFGCAAIVLAQGLHWFTVVPGVVFAFVGALTGSMLDACAESKWVLPPHPATSTTVANLTAALAGTVWGVASSSGWQSVAFGLPFLVVALALRRRAAQARQWLTREQIASCMWSALAAYLCSAALALAFGVL